MTDDPRIVLLDQLNERLERLLGQLERPLHGKRGDDALMSAWSDCADAFEGVRSVLNGVEGEYSPQVRGRMETALRLHAVAASLAQRSREEVENGLTTLSEIVKRIRMAAAPDEASTAGASCNVQG